MECRCRDVCHNQVCILPWHGLDSSNAQCPILYLPSAPSTDCKQSQQNSCLGERGWKSGRQSGGRRWVGVGSQPARSGEMTRACN